MSRSYTSTPTQQNNDSSLSAILASHLQGHPQSMDGRQPEYSQSGLNSPYASYNGHQSEGSSADPASAAQYQSGQDYKSSNFSSSATPNSDYGLPPQSARSGSFPEYIQRSYADGQQRYNPASAQGGHAGMAQTSSPSLSMPDGQQSNGHVVHHIKSDSEVPIDPSIAASSPTYPPQNQYSPYPPQHEMSHYPGQPPMYGRPEWAGHYGQQMQYGHSPATSGGGAPGMVAQVPRPPAVSGIRCFPMRTLCILTRCRRVVIRCRQCTPLCQFLVRSSIRGRDAGMKRSKECTSVVGMGARRHTAH